MLESRYTGAERRKSGFNWIAFIPIVIKALIAIFKAFTNQSNPKDKGVDK